MSCADSRSVMETFSAHSLALSWQNNRTSFLWVLALNEFHTKHKKVRTKSKRRAQSMLKRKHLDDKEIETTCMMGEEINQEFQSKLCHPKQESFNFWSITFMATKRIYRSRNKGLPSCRNISHLITTERQNVVIIWTGSNLKTNNGCVSVYFLNPLTAHPTTKVKLASLISEFHI